MESFVVSARKYRPVTFDSVVGQSHITTTLKNAIRTNHLASAFLFCGPRGVGKTTCARILAKTINCERLDDRVEPCGECDSCVSFQNNASFNIHELDAASNNSVDDIRNLIDQVRYPPQSGKYKIYIIDEVHMLSTSAFNAFLKTLEEPPGYAIFILATTEKHKILPTILSRCQIFDFNRIQIRDMAEHLARIAQNEGIESDGEALELIAQKADGGLRDALSMFDLNVTFSKDGRLRYADVLENLHILDYDYYFRMTDALLEQRRSDVFLLFAEIGRKGFDAHQFVVGLLEHFRNLLVCQDAATVQLLEVSESVQKKYLDQARRASASFLISALSVGSQIDIHYKSAKNQKLHVEIGLTKLAHLTAVLNLATLPEGGTPNGAASNGTASAATVPPSAPELEKKNAEPGGTPEPLTQEQPRPAYGLNGNGVAHAVPNGTPAAAAVGTIAPPKLTKLKPTIDLNAPAAVPTAAPAAVEPEARFNKPYTFEQLKAAWKQFSEKRAAIGHMGEAVLLDRDFELKGDEIQLGLDNPVQMGLLQDFKADLMHYLRETLQNSDIQIHAFVRETPVQRLPYTQAEKFNYLAEKNPALHELKAKLGLDFDY
jgi:DNA polymerase-3 subunit gamma/tau